MSGFEGELVSGTKSAFGKVAEIIGVAYGAKTAFDFVKRAANDAATIQKSTEVIRAEFGKAGDSVLKFAQGAGIQLGVTGAESESVAARFGILFRNIGIGKAQASAMTLGMEKLGGSLAAIRGVDPSTILERLPLALTGSTRGLKQLGISIDATQIKNEALALGFGKQIDLSAKTQAADVAVAIAKARLTDAEQKYGQGTTQVASAQEALVKAQSKVTSGVKETLGALTPAQRALVIYTLATKNLGDFQKQAAAHAGDYADQQARLRAEWAKARETLGAALLPVLTSYAKKLGDWLGNLEKSGKLQRDLNKYLKIAAEVFGAVKDAVKLAAGIFQSFADRIGGVKKAIELLIAAFVGFKIATWMVAFEQLARRILGVGAAAATASGEAGVGGLVGSFGALGGAAVLGPIAVAVAAVAGLTYGAMKAAGWIQKLADAWGINGGGSISTLAQYQAMQKKDPALAAALLAANPNGVAQLSRAAAAGGQSDFRHGGSAGASSPGRFSSRSSGGTQLGSSQINAQLRAAGASAAEAAYLTYASTTHEDPSGSLGVINDNPKTHDYSVGLFQINFRSMQNQWMRGGQAAAAKLATNAKAQAAYALSILRSQGPGAWPTSASMASSFGLGGSTNTGTGTGTDLSNLVVGTAAKTVVKMTAAQLSNAKASLTSTYKSIQATASGLGSEMTANIQSDMRKARTAIGDVSNVDTVAKARQGLTNLRAEVSAHMVLLRQQITLTNTFGGLKTQIAKLGPDTVPGIASAMAKIRAEIAKAVTPTEINKVNNQMKTLRATIATQVALVKQQAQELGTTFSSAFSQITSRADSAFDRVTQRALAAFQTTVSVAGKSFLFGGTTTQTPTEKLLADMATAQQNTSEAKAVTDAQTQLAAATTALDAGAKKPTTMQITAAQDAYNKLAAEITVSQQKLDSMTADTTGKVTASQIALQRASLDVLQSNLSQSGSSLGALTNPTSDLTGLQDAVTTAQAALDAAKLQQQTTALQAQATVERDAANTQLATAAQQYQDQRDALKTQMDERTRLIEQGMLDGNITAADGMSQLTAVFADPAYGLAAQASGDVLITAFQAGITPGIQALIDLFGQLAAKMKEVGLLPSGKVAPPAASGSSSLTAGLSALQAFQVSNSPDPAALAAALRAANQGIIDAVNKQTHAVVNNPPVVNVDSGITRIGMAVAR